MPMKEELSTMTVRDIDRLLVENPSTVLPDTPLPVLMAKMIEDLRTRHVYVVDEDNKLLGTVRMLFVAENLFPLDAISMRNSKDLMDIISRNKAASAADLMAPSFSVKESSQLFEVARIMMQEKITELPVVDDNGRVTGQVNMYEIIKSYIDML